MAGTSSDLSEKTLVALARALRVARLEAVVIGNSASMLNGAPVTTQDIDLLIRDTKTNRRKLARFAEEIGGASPMPVSEQSNVEFIEGDLAVPVEIHFDRISGGLTFSSVRTRESDLPRGRAAPADRACAAGSSGRSPVPR
jgi:hypothetical protein